MYRAVTYDIEVTAEPEFLVDELIRNRDAGFGPIRFPSPILAVKPCN